MSDNMGKFPHYDKGNFPIVRNFAMGYPLHMQKKNLDAFVRGLKIIMDAEGVKMKPLSEAAGMSETGVKDLIRFGSSPKVSNAVELARVLNRSLDEIVAIGESGVFTASGKLVSIAVPGRAGAGAEVHLVDDYAKGDGLFHVECPPQLSPRGVVAVEVEGNSMEPAYAEGDLLFYSRDALGVPTEAIGRMCIVADEAGRVWVKQVKSGTEAGLFNLLSINPTGTNMHDVRLKWAAPVKLHLPREFVRKV